ncbi:hypothetical protein Ancab_005776, partial [Ancistrocladus abbreviatus]
VLGFVHILNRSMEKASGGGIYDMLFVILNIMALDDCWSQPMPFLVLQVVRTMDAFVMSEGVGDAFILHAAFRTYRRFDNTMLDCIARLGVFLEQFFSKGIAVLSATAAAMKALSQHNTATARIIAIAETITALPSFYYSPK